MIEDRVHSAETAWLSYARDVVSDTTHRGRCSALGGSPEHPGVDAVDLRWPGYLGEFYRSGYGVLVIGNIQRTFASQMLGPDQVGSLVGVTREWRDGAASDEQYLSIVRKTYLAGLSSWTSAKQLRYVCAGLGISLNEVAFTGAARCQYPETSPPLPRPAQPTKLALQRACVTRFPTAALAAALSPQLVLFVSGTAYDLRGLVPNALCVCFHPFTGVLVRPLQIGDQELPVGTVRDAWVPAVVQALVVSRTPAVTT